MEEEGVREDMKEEEMTWKLSKNSSDRKMCRVALEGERHGGERQLG